MHTNLAQIIVFYFRTGNILFFNEIIKTKRKGHATEVIPKLIRTSNPSINKYLMNCTVAEVFGDKRLFCNKSHPINHLVDFRFIEHMILEDVVRPASQQTDAKRFFPWFPPSSVYKRGPPSNSGAIRNFLMWLKKH